MSTNRKKLALIAVVAAVLAGTAGAAAATSRGGVADTENETAITGEALARAGEAALAAAGGGRVTGSEVGDEESYYEVEVTRDDGSQVDVQLDESFTVVDTKADGQEGQDHEGGGDDDRG